MKCSRVVRAGSSTSLQSSCEALEAEAREWLLFRSLSVPLSHSLGEETLRSGAVEGV